MTNKRSRMITKAVKRQVSPDSYYNKTMERWETEYAGPEGFSHHETDWDNDSLDSLLEAFLVSELPFAAKDGRPSLLKVCKRTLGAVKVALWKLAGRYVERRHFADYTPQRRTKRDKADWSPNEMGLIAIATNESGISRGAHRPEWIAKIIGRSPVQVRQFFVETVARSSGFKEHKPDVNDPKKADDVARVIHKTLEPFLKIVLRAIFKAIDDLGENDAGNK